jgi:hypothetical protein
MYFAINKIKLCDSLIETHQKYFNYLRQSRICTETEAHKKRKSISQKSFIFLQDVYSPLFSCRRGEWMEDEEKKPENILLEIHLLCARN